MGPTLFFPQAKQEVCGNFLMIPLLVRYIINQAETINASSISILEESRNAKDFSTKHVVGIKQDYIGTIEIGKYCTHAFTSQREDLLSDPLYQMKTNKKKSRMGCFYFKAIMN